MPPKAHPPPPRPPPPPRGGGRRPSPPAPLPRGERGDSDSPGERVCEGPTKSFHFVPGLFRARLVDRRAPILRENTAIASSGARRGPGVPASDEMTFVARRVGSGT